MVGLKGMIPELLLAILCAVVLLSNPGEAQNQPAQFTRIGDPCGGAKLCPDNAECSGTCKCYEDYVASDDKKLCLKKANEWQGDCVENVQCSRFPNAICVGNICECPQNYHFYDSSCWTTRHLKEECSDNNECFLEIHQDRIECRASTCECKEEYTISDNGEDCNGGNKLWNLGLVSLLLVVSIKQILI